MSMIPLQVPFGNIRAVFCSEGSVHQDGVFAEQELGTF